MIILVVLKIWAVHPGWVTVSHLVLLYLFFHKKNRCMGLFWKVSPISVKIESLKVKPSPCVKFSCCICQKFTSKFIGTLENGSCSINKTMVERRDSKFFSMRNISSTGTVWGISEMSSGLVTSVWLLCLGQFSSQIFATRVCISDSIPVRETGNKI